MSRLIDDEEDLKSERHQGAINPLAQASTTCNDSFFILLYAASVGTVIGLSASYSKLPIKNKRLDLFQQKTDDGERGDQLAFFSILASFGFSIISLVFVLNLMRKSPASFIWFTLMAFDGYLWACSILGFINGEIGSGVVFGLIALLHLGWCYSVRRCIPFSAALMVWVSNALSAFPGTFFVAIMGAFTQGFVVMGGILCFAVFARTFDPKSKGRKGEDNLDAPAGFAFFILFNLFWTSGIIQNIVHVTCSGTLAAWYYQGIEAASRWTVTRSFLRSTTTSLGSIIFGSLLVAIVETARFAARMARNQARDNGGAFALCCLECIIGIIESLLRLFNKYAFVEIAIRGTAYIPSAKAAWALISAQGISLLINNNIIGIAMFISTVTAALTAGAITALAFFIARSDDWMMFGIIVSFAVFIILSILFKVIDSGVCALFVLYANDPEVLHQSNDDLNNHIHNVRRDGYETGHDDPL